MPDAVVAGAATPAPAPAAEPSFREQVESARAQPEPTATPAPAEPSEATPEPTAAEPQQAEADGELNDKEINWKKARQALDASNRANRALAKQIADAQQREQQLQAQQVEMLRYMQQFAQPRAQPPDPATDPLGYQRFGLEQLAQQVGGVQQHLLNQEQRQQREFAERQQAAAAQQFISGVTIAEQAFAKAQPDYFEAVEWAKSRKAAEYEAIGIAPEQAWARVRQEAWQIAQVAAQNGEDPATVAYRLAKQMGYRNRGVSAEQKLAMQAEGQQAAMPGAGSAQSGGKLSLEALTKMHGKDFLEATKGAKWRQVMMTKV